MKARKLLRFITSNRRDLLSSGKVSRLLLIECPSPLLFFPSHLFHSNSSNLLSEIDSKKDIGNRPSRQRHRRWRKYEVLQKSIE